MCFAISGTKIKKPTGRGLKSHGKRTVSLKNKIIGRKEEQKILKNAFDSKKSAFIAIYGRRRVGKTFLVKSFFEGLKCSFVYVSGMKEGTINK